MLYYNVTAVMGFYIDVFVFVRTVISGARRRIPLMFLNIVPLS